MPLPLGPSQTGLAAWERCHDIGLDSDARSRQGLLTLSWAGYGTQSSPPIQSIQVLSLKGTARAALPPATPARQMGAKPLGADTQQRGGHLLPRLLSRVLPMSPGPHPTPLLAQPSGDRAGRGWRLRAHRAWLGLLLSVSVTEGPNMRRGPRCEQGPHPHTLGE